MKKLVALTRQEFEQMPCRFLVYLYRDGWELSLGQRLIVFKQEEVEDGDSE